MKGQIFEALAKGKLATTAKKPEVLLGMGIGLCILGTVSACMATLEVDDILDEAEACNDRIAEIAETKPEAYSEEAQNRDRMRVKVKTYMGLVKLYTPAVTTMGLGIASILASYNLISNRYLALASAYSAISDGFKNYRHNVVEELGEDADKRFRFGIKQIEKEIPILNKKGEETGKTKTVTVDEAPNSANRHTSIYARYFDDQNDNWSETPGDNLYFLKCQEKIANDILQSRGYIFLNEVYDLLGIGWAPEGQIVGWRYGGGYDDYVDFGIYELHDPDKRNFVNGEENIILLDFNVDGIIYDKI